MTICGKKRWLLGALLFVSLAMNFTFAGMMLGRGKICAPPPHHQQRHWDPLASMERKLEALPPEERERGREIIQQYQPDLEAQMQEIKEKRKQTFRFIKSKDYEREAAETQLQDLGEAYRGMQVISQQMMLDLADRLTPEERAKVFRRGRPDENRRAPRHD